MDGRFEKRVGEGLQVNKEYRVVCRNLLSHDDVQDRMEKTKEIGMIWYLSTIGKMMRCKIVLKKTKEWI